MDETFIKMCKEATEIQERWKPTLYDLFGWIGGDGNCHFVKVTPTVLNNFRRDEDLDGYFWVPRQEDLQEIYLNSDAQFVYAYSNSINKHKTYLGILGDLTNWLDYHLRCGVPETKMKNYEFMTTNFEIMWLCFVMETVYNKRWNGSTWEVI